MNLCVAPSQLALVCFAVGGGPWHGAGGQDDSLLMAYGRVAAQNRHAPLPARGRQAQASRTSRWWPTPCRPWRCAALQTLCLMLPPTASAGCCSECSPQCRRHGVAGVTRYPLRGPGGGPWLPSESPPPGCDVQFGQWAITACCASLPGWPGPCWSRIRVCRQHNMLLRKGPSPA